MSLLKGVVFPCASTVALEIYNSLGQLLATHQVADFRIDNLSSGMHVMKITTSEGAIHKNFIKK